MLTDNQLENEDKEQLVNRDKTRKQAIKILIAERDARPNITLDHYQRLERELLLGTSEIRGLETQIALLRSENIKLISNIESQIEKLKILRTENETQRLTIDTLSAQLLTLQQDLVQAKTEKKEASEAAERERKARDEAVATSSHLTLKFNAVCEAQKEAEKEVVRTKLESANISQELDKYRAQIQASHGVPDL